MSYLPIQYKPQPTPDIPTVTGEPAPRPLLPCADCASEPSRLVLMITSDGVLVRKDVLSGFPECEFKVKICH